MEYERNGAAHLLAFYAPFENRRRVDVAVSARRLSAATCITFVMDNLSTHSDASLYKAFPPSLARSLLDKLEFVYTPRHGSWLNLAECELSGLGRQCLDRRLPDIETVTS